MSMPFHESREQKLSSQISLCIPSSAISETNALNLEQITHVAYQIAKAATLYNVSEIIVLDIPRRQNLEVNTGISPERKKISKGEGGNMKIKFENRTESRSQKEFLGSVNASSSSLEDSRNSNNALLLAGLLQYFITPRYLVRSVFQKSHLIKKFKYAEKLPGLSSLPFMMSDRSTDNFKEGFTVSKNSQKVRKKNKKETFKVTKYVNIGEPNLLELKCREVPTNVRVTVDLRNKKIVSPNEAYGLSGHTSTHGYHVRLAKKVSSVFTESFLPQGYTESIFVNANNFFSYERTFGIPKKVSKIQGQVLVMIGNLRVLNSFFKQELIDGVTELSEMFDSEINVPRGLRIEDAALVSLTMLHYSVT